MMSRGDHIAPGDRYQVVGSILEKAGTPPVECLWQTIHYYSLRSTVLGGHDHVNHFCL